MVSETLDLLTRARGGDSEALGKLCALYENYLRMVIRTGLGPRLRARVELSDAIQETLVEVVRQFPRFTGQTEAAVVGWLRCLAGQKLADLGKYYGRAKRAGDATAAPLDSDPRNEQQGKSGTSRLDMLALSQTSPSEAASRREQLARLADAVASLAGPEADVLWLYFVEEITFGAIGERLELSRKAVSRICASGLKHVRRSLDGPPGGTLKFDEDPTPQ
jgi:RNA polymerase sigma-70 factor (ECF subfamily)